MSVLYKVRSTRMGKKKFLIDAKCLCVWIFICALFNGFYVFLKSMGSWLSTFEMQSYKSCKKHLEHWSIKILKRGPKLMRSATELALLIILEICLAKFKLVSVTTPRYFSPSDLSCLPSIEYGQALTFILGGNFPILMHTHLSGWKGNSDSLDQSSILFRSACSASFHIIHIWDLIEYLCVIGI